MLGESTSGLTRVEVLNPLAKKKSLAFTAGGGPNPPSYVKGKAAFKYFLLYG